MKIYISGRITGMDVQEWSKKFNDAQEIIERLGHEAVNPGKIDPGKQDPTWHDYMKADIKQLVDCEAIWMLDNYKGSKGASVELDIAKALDMLIINE